VIDLDPAAHEVARLLSGVSDDQLRAPTPCEDTPVAGLLDHLAGLSLAFTWAARKSPEAASTPPPAMTDQVDPRWRELLPERLDDLVRAWREPSAWEGVTQAGGVHLPAEVAGIVALDELVLHGWDLARATGQPFGCDPASTRAVLEFTAAAAAGPAEERAGLFGPAVPVPDDAPDLDRALGFAGRDPHWSPAPVVHQR
jgi:uncharacterized protein (TIGR03086 family)